jgi:threonine aldolase
MCALSKGLGCPAGSLVVGERPAIKEARRLRKLLGGGMRQVGVLAAAGLVALDAGFAHLADDHRRAKRIAAALGVYPDTVDTNSVIATVPEAHAAAESLAEAGVRAIPISPTELRLVTHRDVGDAETERAVEACARLRGRA